MTGRFIWRELNQKKLTLDQTSTPLDIDHREFELFYHPLAVELIEHSKNQNRLLAAIAGPPGSGKTAFATLLVAVINAELKSDQAVMISQDGWHYPEAYLDSHIMLHNGEAIPLSQIKGAPETFDTSAAFKCLHRIKLGESLNFPVYSRERHEPIQDAGIVRPDHRWIIVEGNYWLLQEPAWQQFQPLFDITIFLTADPDTLIDGLRQRHLRGGKDPVFIEKHINNVDIPDIHRVLDHSSKAQIEVQKKNSQQVAAINYHEGGE